MKKKRNESRQQIPNFLRNVFNLEQFELLPNVAVALFDQKSGHLVVLDSQLLMKLLHFFKIDTQGSNFQINLAHYNYNTTRIIHLKLAMPSIHQ
jgi:hypothetical protein